MPIADLPYRIERLATEGLYAYLARPAIRTKAIDEESKKVRVKAQPATRLRVLRNVNLCDGPSLWDSIRTKREAAIAKSEDSLDEYTYAFYVALRLFATRSMVEDYLASPEVASYCLATNTALPTLKEEDLIITEESYLNQESAALTASEYGAMLQSRDTHLSMESLEELVCQIQGIESIETLNAPKRGRKKISAAPPTPPVVEVTTTAVIEEPASSDEEAAPAPPTPSDRPSTEASKAKLPKKRKPRATLRDQFVLVQNTPSRLIDVSGYGDTMQHQRGRVLDRVRHGERLAKCTVLPDLFPIVSDNIPAFERAMSSLGSRFSHRVQQFRTVHALRLKEKQVAA